MSTKSTKSVSIILVSFNGKHLLRDCLLSLQKLKYPRNLLEIIVVDNGSTDGTKEWLLANHKNVQLLEMGWNSGFAKANNAGARQARGEMLFFVNNDTKMDPFWLQHAINRLQSKSNIVAVNGKTYLWTDKAEKVPRVQNAGSIVFRTGFGRDRGAVVEGYEQTYETDCDFYNEPCQLLAFCGVGVLIKKDAFLRAGAFEESMFMYYEDTDLSLRLTRLGYEIWYEPKSLLWHKHAASSREYSPLFLFEVEKNHLLLVARNLPLQSLVIEVFFYVLQCIGSWMRYGKNRLLGRYGESQDWWGRAYLRSKVCAVLLWQIPVEYIKTVIGQQKYTVSRSKLYDQLY